MTFPTRSTLRRYSGPFAISFILVFATTHCASQGPVIKRVPAQTATDLSGTWNDTDARLTSQSLIDDCFAASWMGDFLRQAGRKPAIRIASITNKTDEHIDAEVFLKNIEAAIVKSGRARVLAQAGLETSAIDSEQARAASGRQAATTSVQPGQEFGADFVVAVHMTSIVDQIEGRMTKFYKINVELISPTTGEKNWIGDYEIKKLISQKKVKW
jgi:PBP1b-binding outer membrane lipoprotein LpoB